MFYPDLKSDEKSDNTQLVTFKNFKFSQASTWLQLYSESSPFIYDPGSGYLFVTGLDLKRTSNGTERVQGETYYSKNMGITWDTLTIFDEQGFGMLYPSLSVYNPNNSKIISDMGITLLGGYTDESKEWFFKGGIVVSMWDGSQFVPEVSDFPESNNPGNDYVWNPMRLVTYKKPFF